MIHFKNGKLLWAWLTIAVILITVISAMAIQWTKVDANTQQIIINKTEINESFNNIKTEVKEQFGFMNERFNSIEEEIIEQGKILIKIDENIKYIQRDINELKQK